MGKPKIASAPVARPFKYTFLGEQQELCLCIIEEERGTMYNQNRVTFKWIGNDFTVGEQIDNIPRF